jgi:hypothetical protein
MKRLLLLAIPPTALVFSALTFFGVGLPYTGYGAGALGTFIAAVGLLNALATSQHPDKMKLTFWAVTVETFLHLGSAALLILAPGWTYAAVVMSVAVLADVICLRYAD